MNTNAGFLFLCHRGLGMMDDLIERARALGFESYVLYSKPSTKNEERVSVSAGRADWARSSGEPSLAHEPVDQALLSLATAGKRVVGCVSVWEGYRRLMAEVNLRLGTNDLSPFQVDFLLDKYRVRMALLDKGLSRIETQILTPGLLPVLAADGRPRFVKPRRGIASIGAFKLSPTTTHHRLLAIMDEIAADEDYRDIGIQRQRQFIVEDYIRGGEYSFETILDAGAARIVAVHEKIELEEQAETTLESACLSPPLHLSDAALEAGRAFVTSCLAAVELKHGLFHVEAKYDAPSERWEIVEINPRVGGALINASVQSVTNGTCLLDLWLRQLAGQLEREKPAPTGKAAFFRVYFGKPGRRIRSIDFSSEAKTPKVLKVMGKAGDQLPNSSREIFLGQALWEFKLQDLSKSIDSILLESKSALKIEYQPSL